MKPTAIVSWCVILLIAIGIPVLNHLSREPRNAAHKLDPAAPVDIQTTISGKYTVGSGLFGFKEQRYEMIAAFDAAAKTPIQKVAAAVVVGELADKSQAISRLTHHDLPANEAFLALYQDGTPLPANIEKQFGFFAHLAQANGKPDTDPARADVVESAKIAVLLVFAGLGLAGLGLLVGLGLLITAIILAATGKLRFAVGPPLGPTTPYVEAFALYLLSFVFGGLLLVWLVPNGGFALNMLPLIFGVVLALIWPKLRGVQPADQRHDWGLYVTRKFPIDVLAGLGGYLAGLPLLAGAVVVSALLGKLTDTELGHPIQNVIADQPLLMAFLAVIFAPITEETLFRGAFVSHLRSFANPFLAALISGLIFAAIHPQGWVGIPVIATIGFSLALIRQWRGSLVSSMTAHALNNGALVAIMLLVLKS